MSGDVLGRRRAWKDVPATRPARPEDAPAIYSLLCSTLPPEILRYSIYQAPASVHYLQRLLERNVDAQYPEHVVIPADGVLLGYSHARRKASEFFLNYLCVASLAQGSGFGSALLALSEETAARVGCTAVALDVLETNRRARRLYVERGYTCRSRFLNVQVPMAQDVTGGPSLEVGARSWARAREEEEEIGFSRVECTSGSARVVVGVLAGRVCKLIACEGLTGEQAAHAIVRRFQQERDVLLMTHLDCAPRGLRGVAQDAVLRFEKHIDSRRCATGMSAGGDG